MIFGPRVYRRVNNSTTARGEMEGDINYIRGKIMRFTYICNMGL